VQVLQIFLKNYFYDSKQMEISFIFFKISKNKSSFFFIFKSSFFLKPKQFHPPNISEFLIKVLKMTVFVEQE
jgi:hypothetical protein